MEGTYSFALLGDDNVGKTCFVEVMNNADFDFNTRSTLGFNLKTFTFDTDTQIDAKTDILPDKLSANIYDISRMLIYESVDWINSKDAIILGFDITDNNTFIYLETIIRTIKSRNNKERPIYLLGFKSDLKSQKSVNDDDILFFMARNNIGTYKEISSKNQEDVTEAITDIVLRFAKNRVHLEIDTTTQSPSEKDIVIDFSNVTQTNVDMRGGCCNIM